MPPLAVGVVLLSTVMHVVWNLAAKQHSADWSGMLRLLATVSIPGVLILLWAELFTTGLSVHVWPLVVGAGCCQGIYYLGLTLGYRSGDLSVIYPMTRALPVVFIGVFDLVRRLNPSVFGWAGLFIVAIGCIFISRSGDRVGTGEGGRVRSVRRIDPAVGWAVIAAAGTVGYTVLDKIAAEILLSENGSGLVDALHYGLWEIVIATVVYAPMLLVAMRISLRRSGIRGMATSVAEVRSVPQQAGAAEPTRRWKIAPIGICMFAAYALVLWAYQLSERASYVVALRQFSIVLGVLASVVLMREQAPFVRIVSAIVITAGIALVSVAK